MSMSELRECFDKLGFTNVSTYINSGNIFFDTDETDVVKLVEVCENAIEQIFGFVVVVMVISKNDYAEALQNAPSWWADGTEGTRNDALFVIPPTATKEVLDELSKKTSTVDRLASHGQVIFWTLPKAAYNKSVVPKMIGTPVYKRVTMRSSTTTKKLETMFHKA